MSTPQKAPAQSTSDVLALFSRRCVECHGPSKQSATLRLDSLDAVFRGGRSGPPVLAGKSEESLLYQRVQKGAEKRMPLKKDPLTDSELDLIRRWIDSGAKAEASPADARASEQLSLRPEALPRDFSPVFCLAGDPVGSRFALGRGLTVEVRELLEAGGEAKSEGKAREAKTIATLRGFGDVVQALAFSRDGKRLAAGEFGVVKVWDSQSWELLGALGPHPDRVLALVFSPDGKRLASGGGLSGERGEVKVWDLETGALAWSVAPHSDTVFALDWQQDGTRIITGGADRVTYVLEATDGKTIRRLEAHTHHVLGVALSPDGKRAVSAGADRTARLWDVEKGEYLRALRVNEKSVTSAAFSPDGKEIVTTSGDGTVRFWDPENQNQRGSFGEAKNYLQAGAYFSGGKRYAAAEQDGAVRVYDME